MVLRLVERLVIERVNALMLSTPLPVRPGEVVLGGRPCFLERHMPQSSAPRAHDLIFRVHVDATCAGEGPLQVGGAPRAYNVGKDWRVSIEVYCNRLELDHRFVL